MQTQPVAERPLLPDGYVEEEKLGPLLPWSHVEERLAEAINLWFVTADRRGMPHVSPLWAVWVDDHLYFDGSPESKRVRNMKENPHMAVHLESGENVLMMYGTGEEIVGAPLELRERLAAEYKRKYVEQEYAPDPAWWAEGGLYKMTVSKVIAWTAFLKDPTRWRLKA